MISAGSKTSFNSLASSLLPSLPLLSPSLLFIQSVEAAAAAAAVVLYVDP